MLFMSTGIKVVVALILLGIADVVIPVPITGLMLIYVIMQKPAWFLKLVWDIYGIE